MVRFDHQRFDFQILRSAESGVKLRAQDRLETNRGENGLVLRDGDDAQPVPEVLQERTVGNVVHLLIAQQENLSREDGVCREE